MENESASPDSPKQSTPAQTRDPLIRYSVFAALGCAGVCMIFTILYVFSYSLDSTLSFERHFDSYLASGNTSNLSTVLGLHMAQNRMFLQSCGMVAGIFFAFLGLALFLVGIQGTVDATGQIKDYSASAKRLAPGGIILLASMIFVGVSAMHPIDFKLGPIVPATIIAPTAAVVPPVAPTVSAPVTAQPTTQTTSPTATQPSTQSEVQPTTPPTSAPATAHLAPQSAPIPATNSALRATPLPTTPPATQQPATSPALSPTPRPASRPALVPVNQSSVVAPQRLPPQHRFQP
jgi:hypothetical protein